MVDNRPNNIVRLSQPISHALHSIPADPEALLTCIFAPSCCCRGCVLCYRRNFVWAFKNLWSSGHRRSTKIFNSFVISVFIPSGCHRRANQARDIDNNDACSCCSIHYTLTSMPVSHLLAQPTASRAGAMLTMCKLCFRCWFTVLTVYSSYSPFTAPSRVVYRKKRPPIPCNAQKGYFPFRYIFIRGETRK